MFAGPSEFANHILAYVRTTIESSNDDSAEKISAATSMRLDLALDSIDGWLHQLVEQCFVASLLTEEMRCTNCRLVWAPTIDPTISIDPERLSPELIRRLAQIAHEQKTAIMIDRTDKPRVTGITQFDQFFPSIDLIPKSVYGSTPFVSLRIVGPAHLRMSFASKFCIQCFEIKAGQILELHRQTGPDPLGLHDTCRRYRNHNPMMASAMISSVLQRLLFRVINASHGGLLVIATRKAINDSAESIKVRFNASSNLERTLTELLQIDLEMMTQSGNTQGKDVCTGRRQKLVATLADQIDSLADLTLIDGAVVLDESLNLIGFGAAITGHVSDSEKDGIAKFNKTDGGKLSRMGHRRLAGMTAALRIEGASAFVVSQDGDVRVFESFGSTVKFTDDFRPMPVIWSFL